MKVKINAQPDKGQPLYSHLDPLIDFLLDQGNQLFSDSYRWACDRTGYICWLRKAIPREFILSHFELPPSIHIDDEGNMDCHMTYTRIKYREQDEE